MLQLVSEERPTLMPNDHDQVLIKMLAAPINPADINTIEGKYPIKPPLPAVPGSEGVGQVIGKGANVKNIEEGDHVIILKQSTGTWQTHMQMESRYVKKVPKQLDIIQAATLKVNPCTAYVMLKKFCDLQPRDTVIQNGANSICGQFVIQLCKNWGFKTINIIRDRPNVHELIDELKSLGADVVVTEEELRTSEQLKTLPKPRLALNCVGGKNALEMARKLDDGGIIVTYGGMSRAPVPMPASFLFKDLKFLHFWLTKWSESDDHREAQNAMLDDLIQMVLSKKIRTPSNFCFVDFNNFQEALEQLSNISGKIGKKFVLKFPVN